MTSTKNRKTSSKDISLPSSHAAAASAPPICHVSPSYLKMAANSAAVGLAEGSCAQPRCISATRAAGASLRMDATLGRSPRKIRSDPSPSRDHSAQGSVDPVSKHHSVVDRE